MKTALKLLLAAGVLAALGAVSYGPAIEYWKQRNRPHWRTAPVTRGGITSVVNSTGTVKPVLSVSVGSFVSGPILQLHADFNQMVNKDQLLAKIDPRLYEANVARDRAVLLTREADVERAKAVLQQAVRDENRAKALRAENQNFMSQSEMDKVHFNALSLAAQLKLAEAAVDQARAALENSQANLDYTEIRSPVDGMVIDRKIDQGQTLAAQFQTPELFIVAPEMEKKMHVFASVDEADIGLIHKAQTEGRPVHFRVDAYPDDLFEGHIEQIRKNSTTTQNVVTYPVVVSAANPDLKLLPGMTASISFQIDRKEKVVRIPNSALRFYPQVEHVRPDDRELLEGESSEGQPPADGGGTSESMLSAAEKAAASRGRNRRHVWIVAGEYLRAVEVQTGLSDNKFTELVSGNVKPGDELVTGIKPKKNGL